jgi:hypothetical protein
MATLREYIRQKLFESLTDQQLKTLVGDAKKHGVGVLSKDDNANKDAPYTYTFSVEITSHYNPKYGDSRICICGHPYCRHFDTYEDMAAIGCKYCQCETGFVEKT